MIENADWEKYIESLDFRNFIPNVIENANNTIDEIVESFTSVILSAANAAIPRTREPKDNKRILHWWTRELTEITIQKKKAFKRYRKTKSNIDKLEFHSLQTLQKGKMAEAKRKSWRSFVESINSFTTSNEVWKKIGRIKGKKKKKAINCVEVDKKIISDPKEVCAVLADHFYNISSNSNMNHEYRDIKNNLENKPLNSPTLPNIEPLNMPFTMPELQEVIKNLKGTSEGEDRIHNMMIKNLSKTGQEALLRIVNKIWNEQVFPSQWQSALVIPIPKPEKDPKNPSNIRGISLISCTAKVIVEMTL